MTKEALFSWKSNKSLIFFGPCLNLILILAAFILYPRVYLKGPFFWVLFFFCLRRIRSFLILICGWSSNSIYGILGAVRARAQRISYEVCFYFILFFPLFLGYSLSSKTLPFPRALLFMPVIYIFLLVILAETNRAPFDFAEGERELVSGFNVEFSRFLFVLLFLAEYGWMLLLSWFRAHLLFSNILISGLGAGAFAIIILVIRGSFPRFRYDLLIKICWGGILPISIALFRVICL